ncbi:endonuclease domain-containing protein [Arthrobacter sp. PAMC25284]|nr:endonuclease domain-containing protein [Arthrobacter sp. PAMC25284]
MHKKTALPGSLGAAPFTLTDARNSGVTTNRLRQADVDHVSRGLYRPTDWDFEREAAARVLSEATPGGWISHVTAARLHSQLLPPWLSDSEELHLSKPGTRTEVRRRGIVGHAVLALEGEVETVNGIRISTRSRTWLDLARRLNLAELVCMGDELIRQPRAEFEGRNKPYATVDSLRAMVGRHPNLQGVIRARQALDLMRIGADSAPETQLRLAIADAGLPEPELQLLLWPGARVSPSADLGYRRRRLAIQYDGGHHLLSEQMFGDRRRDKAFEAAGWTVLILGKDDLSDNFKQAVAKLKQLLRTAWRDHPAASGFADAG